jgi:hypothetical protein
MPPGSGPGDGFVRFDGSLGAPRRGATNGMLTKHGIQMEIPGVYRKLLSEEYCMHHATINCFRPRTAGRWLSTLKLTAMLSACSLASAATLFQRDLPSSGLNLSGVSRSNIAPVQGTTVGGGPFILGDDFTLTGTGSFLVNSITVWTVGNCPVTTCTPTNATPSTEFSSIQLFGGLDNGTNGPVSLLSSTYSSTHVQYSGGLDYLSPGNGLSYPIFQITFSSLGLVIPGSQLYDFAISGTPTSTNSFALHASTAAISGGIQQGADNLVLGYQGSPLLVTFGVGAGNFANFTNGADVNVLVVGTAIAVPEPSTSALYSLGLGVLALAAFRRRA